MISREYLAQRDGYLCFYCKSKFDQNLGFATRDHVVPLSGGGTNDASNLVLACGWCNQLKGDMTLDEFLEKLPGLLILRWGKDHNGPSDEPLKVPKKFRANFPTPQEIERRKREAKRANLRADFERKQAQIVEGVAEVEVVVEPSWTLRSHKPKKRKKVEVTPVVTWNTQQFPVGNKAGHIDSLECPCEPYVSQLKANAKWRVLVHHRLSLLQIKAAVTSRSPSWASESIPDEAFVHQPSMSCACKPQVKRIHGGRRILEHRKMTAAVTAEG